MSAPMSRECALRAHLDCDGTVKAEGFGWDSCDCPCHPKHEYDEIRTYHTRPREVRALRIKLGYTSRTDILALCPDANIGVSQRPDGTLEEKDIRWVVLPSGEAMEDDGDWVVWVSDSERGWRIISDEEFRTEYEYWSQT